MKAEAPAEVPGAEVQAVEATEAVVQAGVRAEVAMEAEGVEGAAEEDRPSQCLSSCQYPSPLLDCHCHRDRKSVV